MSDDVRTTEIRGPDRAALDETVTAAASALGIPLPDHPRIAESTPGIGHAGELFREAVLEAADASGYVVAGKDDGPPVFYWTPVPPPTAHIWLLGRLFGRIEAMVAGETLPALERVASHWYFRRWTGRGRGEKRTFTRRVREQEWSLVERIVVDYETTALLAFMDWTEFDAVPDRQRRLARALRRSFAGVFTTRKADGHRSVLEDAASGRRYDVHEHNPEETAYSAGETGVGRLIPFGDTHLRSPGMVFFPARDAALVGDMARMVERGEAETPRAIVVEAALAAAVDGEDVPRRVRPARNRKAARSLLEQLTAEFEDAGLAYLVTPEDVPEDMRRRGEDVEYREYAVDRVIAEWMDALTRQAHGRRR